MEEALLPTFQFSSHMTRPTAKYTFRDEVLSWLVNNHSQELDKLFSTILQRSAMIADWLQSTSTALIESESPYYSQKYMLENEESAEYSFMSNILQRASFDILYLELDIPLLADSHPIISRWLLHTQYVIFEYIIK